MADPIPMEELRRFLAQQGPFARLGVAVSGGGDSVAALVLAVDVLGPDAVCAVTVDHGLRTESAAEAAQVAWLCGELGVRHSTLQWQGPTGGNLQQAARQARLDLIGAWAQGRVGAGILAHTRDDQAETVLMRLARGSGVDGLAAMADVRDASGVTWLRPFLETPREALRDVLRGRGVSWVEDPSNSDPRFQRVRAREALAVLATLGIDAQTLTDTAHHMRRARTALEHTTGAALLAHTRDEAGTVVIAKAALMLDPEIRDRLFAHLLMALSGAWHRPRLDALQRLIAERGTLMGCVLVDEGAHLRLYREAWAVADLCTPVDALWDGRWQATGPATGPATGREVIRALGASGLAQLSLQANSGQHRHWRETGFTSSILAAMPSIWIDNTLISAPLAFWPQKWHIFARPVAAHGNGFELSH